MAKKYEKVGNIVIFVIFWYGQNNTTKWPFGHLSAKKSWLRCRIKNTGKTGIIIKIQEKNRWYGRPVSVSNKTISYVYNVHSCPQFHSNHVDRYIGSFLWLSCIHNQHPYDSLAYHSLNDQDQWQHQKLFHRHLEKVFFHFI